MTSPGESGYDNVFREFCWLQLHWD